MILRAAAREAAMAMGSAVVWVVAVDVGTGLRFRARGVGTDCTFCCFSGVVFADVAGVVVAVADALALALGLVLALPLVIVPTRGV